MMSQKVSDNSNTLDLTTLDRTSISAQGPATDNNLAYLLYRVHTRLTNMLTKGTQSELGVTGMQARILHLLESGRCDSSSGLAQECGIDQSAVTRLIDRLKAHGLVHRVRSATDRRIVQIELTEHGRALAARVPPIARAVIERVQAGLTPAEVGFLVSLLRHVNRNCD
nr:MarR family transcriptional regulator [Paraburkholderia phytofirmans]